MTAPHARPCLERATLPPEARLLADVLDVIGECVLIADVSGRILHVNRTTEQILGRPLQELAGANLASLRASTRPGEVGATSGLSLPAGALAYQRKDGSAIPMHIAVHQLDGGALQVHVLRDLTPEMRLREQLLQSEKMSAVGQLVSGVAHDLNNPLTTIVGYAQLLGDRNEDPGFRHGLEVISSEAERASRIVRNLLAFARKQEPEKRYLGLNGIIAKTLDLKIHNLHVNRVEVVTDFEPELPKTLLDYHQMQQVVLNLLTNAAQAICQEKGEGHIRIATRSGGLGIQVLVEDDGPGIPQENLGRVFDPFFTTKPAEVGTGLGLSICHGIIGEHGGTIRVENRPEGGARFVIELPIHAAEGAAGAPGQIVPAPRPTPAAQVSPVPPVAGQRSILVVDDEQTIQDLLVAILTREGHGVDTAPSGQSAVKKIRSRRYDLILADLRMPGMTGMEFYERLCRDSPETAERIIFMTGDLANVQTAGFVERTSNLYLAKPFTLETLRDTLRRFTERFPAN